MARHSTYLSTYRQYKADTDVIATYLASTAKRPQASQVKLSKTAKAKAKKRARAVGQTNAPTQEKDPQLPNYVIAIKEFIPLATEIASLTTAVNVPRQFVSALRRAIALRRKAWYLLEQTSKDTTQTELFEDGKDGHEYFFNVLESVQEILKPFMSVPDRQTSAEAEKQADDQAFTNYFDSLNLEEPSHEFLNASSVPRNTSSKPEEAPIEINYEAEQRKDICESMIAFACLVRDMMVLRDSSTNAWRRYAEARLPFPQAAIISNTVMELARCIEEEVSSVIAPHGGNHLTYFLLMAFTLTQGKPENGYEDLKPFGFESKAHVAGASILLQVMMVLVEILEEKKKGHSEPPKDPPIDVALCASMDKECKAWDKHADLPASQAPANTRNIMEMYFAHNLDLVKGMIPHMEAYRVELKRKKMASKAAIDEFS